ncbi:hypothetical protein TH53_11565 [Pedobacter lusitanus]|uniref:BT-3987-like N-terminal domain-containing protein n=1 Tax=Pedobacter lusitanus TaxID=1503925 RepID=A0A0D0GIA0_9SPHI|nr:DUF1735 domain-containing protein [Pedobacter lusitanus]KIO77002.1 hypothetical protein TH53_11565 [Pedobacter lusitanus]
MKRYISKYTTIALIASIITSSCTKEEGVFADGGSSGIVELQLPARSTSTIYSITSRSFAAQDVVDFPVTLNYTGVNGTPEDVTVNVEVNNLAVTQYNTALNTSYTPLPQELYIVAANNVSIPKGTKTGTFLIKLKTASFDFTKSYALGVTIRTASSGTVSGNYSTGIYRVTAKNAYEGDYKVTGWFFHPTAGRAINVVKKLVTTGKQSVSAPLGDLGSSNYAIEFTVDGSKLTGYKASGATPGGLNSGFFTADHPEASAAGWINNPASADQPGQGQWKISGYNNSYDAATGTFNLAYGYIGSGGTGESSWSRQVYEKWVKQ